MLVGKTLKMTTFVWYDYLVISRNLKKWRGSETFGKTELPQFRENDA